MGGVAPSPAALNEQGGAMRSQVYQNALDIDASIEGLNHELADVRCRIDDFQSKN